MKIKKIEIIFILSLIIIFGIFVLSSNQKSAYLQARVYHREQLILEIDLSKISNRVEYEVQGTNEIVVIECENNMIRIKDNDICPNKTCIHMGYTSSSYKPILCVPNEIMIKLIKSEELDGVV